MAYLGEAVDAELPEMVELQVHVGPVVGVVLVVSVAVVVFSDVDDSVVVSVVVVAVDVPAGCCVC